MKELISAAVLPAIFLLMYVRKKDKIESEPVGLVIKLFIYGGITVITAMIMETIGLSLIKNALDEDTMPYLIVEYFIVVAGSEEAGKYFGNGREVRNYLRDIFQNIAKRTGPNATKEELSTIIIEDFGFED